MAVTCKIVLSEAPVLYGIDFATVPLAIKGWAIFCFSAMFAMTAKVPRVPAPYVFPQRMVWRRELMLAFTHYSPKHG
jgi:hypothetical protein